MEQNKHTTEVIFRKYKDGEIIALFPYLIDNRFGSCMSYMHIGQHSGAVLSIIDSTKLATEIEYKDLYSELTNIVGYKLKVKKKMNWNKYRIAFLERKLS